jgi:alkanesulfonate monooxygenase SsuD/methylene tetrahydromethanopterin reductase-like flavin-dependent oxidoreductase (luciferase family)
MHIGFSSMNTPQDPEPTVLAKALEERGFESLWYGEHSHIPTSQKTPYPGGGEMPAPYRFMADPYVSLMAAASVTTKLKLGTGIALVMERDIFSQAITIATLDRLSNGRVIIGTGVGWNEEEFRNVNQHPWNKRYAVMRETVAALKTIWSEDEPEYHGDYIVLCMAPWGHWESSTPRPGQMVGYRPISAFRNPGSNWQLFGKWLLITAATPTAFL